MRDLCYNDSTLKIKIKYLLLDSNLCHLYLYIWIAVYKEDQSQTHATHRNLLVCVVNKGSAKATSGDLNEPPYLKKNVYNIFFISLIYH